LLDAVFAGKDNLTTLAVEAARKALEMAKVDSDDLDLILLCTSTPEDLFGSAPQVRVKMYCVENNSQFCCRLHPFLVISVCVCVYIATC